MFDAAVKSRIHIMLHYPSPDLRTRKLLWEQKLKPLADIPHEMDLDMASALQTLSSYEMNGREIANSVASARTIARRDSRAMVIDDLVKVLEVWKESRLDATREGGDGAQRGRPAKMGSAMAVATRRVLATARNMALPRWVLRVASLVLFVGGLRQIFFGLWWLRGTLLRRAKPSK
jgi:hypothetical protein